MGIFGFGKAVRIAELKAENDTLSRRLAAEKKRATESGRLAAELLAERDAARIERDTAQRERDSYRERLLRFTAPRERGPGGRFMKMGASFPVPGSAADVSPPLHRTIS